MLSDLKMTWINKNKLCALTIYLGFTVHLSCGLRILGLFPFQVRSHFVMCEELMRGLAAKGHQVDVYSHFPLKTPIPNYKDYSLKGTIPPIFNNLTFQVAFLGSGSDVMRYWLQTHGKGVCNLMELPLFQKLLHDPPRDPPYDLVINEISAINCYIPWGRRLNVPIIGVVTPPLFDWMFAPFGTPINLAAEPSIFSPYSAPMTFFERLDNLITFNSLVRTFSRYTRDQNEYVEKFFGPGYPNVMDIMKDVSLVLVNYDLVLSGMRPFAPNVVPAPGLHIIDHNETLPEVVQKWLDESKFGCIYFSFGSMTRIETLPRHVLDVFYKSFQNIAPVRVLLKIAKPEEMPPDLPTNVLTQPWLHQIQVLKHKNVKAFVNHGGLMGIQESVFYAVPMVCIPLYVDQPFNAEASVKKKIAIKVNIHGITEETFTNALNEILKNPLYQKSMQKISRVFKDRPMSPMGTAIFWIEYVSRHGKDVLKSPIADMPWWQASLLDVYAFIVSSILLLFYISVKVIRIIVLFSITLYSRANSKVKKN